MKKKELNEKVKAVRISTKEALQILYDALNQGQQKKVVKNTEVKAMFDRYGVEYTGNRA